MNHLQKSALATAVALACVTPAHAAFNFFNNGDPTQGSSISGYTVNAGNFLFDNIAPTATSPDRTSFQLLGQTTIANFGAGVTAATGFEYTLVMSVPMLGQLDSSGRVLTSVLDTVNAGKPNFFTMYYSAMDSNPQLGTGFTNCAAVCGPPGSSILTGRVVLVDGFNVTDNSTPGGLNTELRLLDDRAGTYVTPTVGQANNQIARSFTSAANSVGGGTVTGQRVLTINAKGSATLIIEVDSTSANFFPGAPNFITANFEVAANPQFSAPYIDVAPSVSYAEVGGGTPNFGLDTAATFAPDYPGGANAGGHGVTNLHAGAPSGWTAGTPEAQQLTRGIANFTVNNFRCRSAVALDTPNPDTTPGICDFATQGAGSGSFSGENIPEPNTMALLGLGLLGFGALSRKLRNKAA